MTQNNFGNTYKILADAEKEVEKKAANHKLAIEAYHKTLKVYSFDHFPIDYAMAEYNLGKAYRSLAELEEKAKNCRLAIAAFQEALKVRSFDQFPILYAKTQIGLGIAYGTLLDVEDKPGNCRRAREAFEEALKVYTEELPEPHVKVIHNLEKLYRLCEDVPGF
jgi:tetratricopeptide (TPR) repeat protein